MLERIYPLNKNNSTKDELEDLVQLISQRVGRCLERQGLLEQDTESAWLELDPTDEADAMPHILGSSASYRIAVGPQQVLTNDYASRQGFKQVFHPNE